MAIQATFEKVHGRPVRKLMTGFCCFAAFAAFAGGMRAQEAVANAGQQSQAEREKQLAEALNGATLVGHFTDTSKETIEPRKEEYTLESVRKLENGFWLFRSRIRYGDHDITVPLTLPVKWAGDTPVITVDKMPVPGLGTFNARVLIFEDHYAGYWAGADHGGHLFGVVKRKKSE